MPFKNLTGPVPFFDDQYRIIRILTAVDILLDSLKRLTFESDEENERYLETLEGLSSLIKLFYDDIMNSHPELFEVYRAVNNRLGNAISNGTVRH